MSLKGRVALVTGASRGIGKAIALKLAQAGADIAVNFRRDDDAAQETVKEIKTLGRRAGAYAASIDDFEADRAMVELVQAELGPISILINNAGIASRGQSVVDTDPSELARVVGTHAFGAHYLSKLVLPQMRRAAAQQGRGDIIMISSAATRGFGGNGAPYNMAKAALEALAYTLYKEERVNGIRVNIVAPGLVETEMGRRLMKAGGVADLRQLDANSPFGRVCQPDDIANVVAFFVSDANSYVTGERVYVDGGGALMARPRPS